MHSFDVRFHVKTIGIVMIFTTNQCILYITCGLLTSFWLKIFSFPYFSLVFACFLRLKCVPVSKSSVVSSRRLLFLSRLVWHPLGLPLLGLESSGTLTVQEAAPPAMGFISFVGRLFFAAIFMLAAAEKIHEFTVGLEGSGARALADRKIALFGNHVFTRLGVHLPAFDSTYLLAAAITLEGVGGFLFIFDSIFGAYLLLLFLAIITPIWHDFYNYKIASVEYSQEFTHFLKNLALFGALLNYVGLKRSAALRARRKKKLL